MKTYSFMSDEVTHNPHDKFFKESFSRKETAVALFKEFLPPSIVQAVDWDTLKNIPCSFIEESLRESRSDLLFEVHGVAEFGDLPFRIYCLFEHQSTQDKWMPLRLLSYMVHIWERFVKENPTSKTLPPIIPIVLHQSLEHWRVSVHFQDLLDIPTHLKEALSVYQPNFSHLLIDLPEIKDTQRLDLSLAVVFQIMRTVEEKTIVEKLHDMMSFLGELNEQRNDMSFLRTCINYLFRADSKVDKQAFFDKLKTIQNNTIKEQTMSIADVLVEHGIERGIERGHQQALIRQIGTFHDMLGYPMPDMAKLSKLSLDDLELQLNKIQAELKVRLS